MLMKSIPRFISVALVTSFLFSFITPSVYATDFQEYDYWTYWYVEQSTGVSAEDVTSTDAGISNGEYIASNGGGTRQDAYNWIKDKYDNATNATAKGIDNYYNAVDDIYNKSVDYAVQGYYTAENALRKTVDTAGKTVYNVSSSDFWSGFYNQMYNGGGYNDIYQDSPNDSYNTSINNVNYTFSKYGVYYLAGNEVRDAPISGTRDSVDPPYILNNGKKNGDAIVSYSGGYVKLSGNPYAVSEFTINSITYDQSQNAYYVLWNMERGNGELYDCQCYLYLNSGFNGSNVTTGGTPVLQPSQMGFIIDPLTGNRIPVYTDPSQNPFTINPDGTVDYNGTTYPIYVDPEEISGDGWLWILDYIDKQDNTKPSQNPYGQPWNTQNDGTILGGLFSGLIQDIASLFDKISKSIADLIGKLVNIITDALKNFLTFLVGDIEGYANLFDSSPTSHFDIVEDLYDLLLQCMGVNS